MMNKGTIRRIVAAAACATFLLCPKLDAANTQFTAVQLSPEEIAWLKKELALKEPEYDPEARMLYCYTKEKHYHSDLEGGVKVHQTRESLEYAVALLKTGDDTLMQRGIDIVRTVLPMQEKDPAYPFCGIWPYYPEDPLRGRQAAVDYNWADFIAVPLIDVVINHADYAGDELVAEIKDALVLAARAIQRRNVQPDYTNICIMGTYVCYITGDICNQPELTAYAQKRLKHFYDYTLRNQHGSTMQEDGTLKKNGSNRCNMKDEKFNEMLDAALVETDVEQRRQDYYEIENYLDEICPIVPICTSYINIGAKKGLVGAIWKPDAKHDFRLIALPE